MEEELKEFGLTENESKIYIALLRCGTTNPAAIAEKTGFSRSYVYDALERLREKNIVSSVHIKNKKQYTAADPRKLVEFAAQRLENIQKVVPGLMALKSAIHEETKVELHKGKFVYKTLLNDIITTIKKDDEVLVYGIDDDALLEQDKYTALHLRQYFARATKLHIREKVIAKQGNIVPKDARNTTYRFLPKNIMGTAAFEVYGNKVAIFLLGTPNHLIVIENQEVANSYRNQFKLLWRSASPK